MTPRPSELPPPQSPDTLYLIDLSGYVFRAYHAIGTLSNSKGEPTNATYGTLNMLTKLIGERKPVLLGFAMEGGHSFRKQLDVRYKATRPAPPPDLAHQMVRCREIAEAYRIPALSSEGFEADDVIATMVEKATADGLRVVIASADKDLMQLVSDRVVMWDAMRDRVYGPAEVEHKFGVPPSKLRDLLALVGDTSDNIPGVPSVGPKTAAELLAQFDSFEGVFQNIDAIKRPKLKQALQDHEADARISKTLVTLRSDVPMSFSREELRYGGADVDRLRELFTELEFGRQLAALPNESRVKVTVVEASFECLTDRSTLEQWVARATSARQVALTLHTSDGEAARCVILGFALAIETGRAAYIPVGHRVLGGPTQLPLAEVLSVLGPMLEDGSVAKWSHDAKRADVVLRRHGIRMAGVTFDVMLASYLQDPEALHTLEAVAEREAGVTLASIETLFPKKGRERRPTLEELDPGQALSLTAGRAEVLTRIVPLQRERLEAAGLTGLLADLELPLALVLGDLEETGVYVETAALSGLGDVMGQELRRLEDQARAASGHDDLNVSSPKQLETILFDELSLRATRKTKTGRSTDAEALEAIADDHPLPAIILEHRAIAKLKGTYVDALPKLIVPATGRIHGHWRQAVAATGRISSEEPNLQNIPIRTELGREIRKAFVAPRGFVFLSADYSQIELRVLAHLSADPVMVEAFRTHQDIHTRTAMEIFGVADSEVTADMRRKSKTINFGVIYGMGEVALSKRLSIPRREAAQFIEAYFKRYVGVAEFMQKTMAMAKKTERVHTLLGRVRLLPDLHNSDRMRRAYAERIAQNTAIQGTAADILKLAMVRLREPVVPGARMILTVHDELDFEIPEGEVETAKARIRTIMQDVVALDVPLVVDIGVGASWAEAK